MADGHGELIAAQARRCADGAKHVVADPMAQRVVDGLEAIRVDQQHADAMLTTTGPRQRVLPA